MNQLSLQMICIKGYTHLQTTIVTLGATTTDIAHYNKNFFIAKMHYICLYSQVRKTKNQTHKLSSFSC